MSRTFTSYSGIANIRDFGAKGDGAFDCTQAFHDFTTAYQGADVVLHIPPGVYNVTSAPSTIVLDPDMHPNFFCGIRNLTVMGYGATIHHSTATTRFWGPYGIPEVSNGSGHDIDAFVSPGSAKVATVIPNPPGDSKTLTLLNSGDSTKIIAGRWALLATWTQQGLTTAGYPPNNWTNEYLQIAGGSGTTVNLVHPVRYAHYQTAPNYSNPHDVGTAHEEGGDATLFILAPGWEWEARFYGLHFTWVTESGSIQWYMQGRHIEFVDCYFDGMAHVPSASQYVSYTGCRIRQTAAAIEIDKSIEFLSYRNCEAAETYIACQSPSINHYVHDNCKWKAVQGTGKNCVIRDCDIGMLMVGCSGYGHTDSLIIEDSHIVKVESHEGPTKELGAAWNFTDGLLWRPISQPAYGGMEVPGTKVLWRGSNTYDYVWFPPEFVVLDSYYSGGNIYLKTTLPTGFNYAAQIGDGTANDNGICLQAHPCPNMTVINCTGCETILNLSQQAPGTPMYTYGYRLMCGHFLGDTGQGGSMKVRGYLESITVNVIKPYTGAGAHNMLVEYMYVDYTTANPRWPTSGATSKSFLIDCKTAGKRILTQTTASGSAGVDSGVVAQGTVWSAQGPRFTLNNIGAASAGAQPVISIEMRTNQGLVGLRNVNTIAYSGMQ